MPGWNSYRAVYGAELRAAAREFTDHGWPVVEQSPSTLLLVTGRVVDVLEVAATPTGSWWYPVIAGAELPPELAVAAGVVWHAAGDAVLAPPSEMPDGW